MYASVPLICKGDECPYAGTCAAVHFDMAPVGELCTREMSLIGNMVNEYCEDLGVEKTDRVKLSLVRDLVQAEIMIARCEAMIARTGEIVEEITVGTDARGESIKQPRVSQYVELLERWMNARHKALNQLNATPKDRAKTDIAPTIDGSRYAAELLRRAQQYSNEIVDVEVHDGNKNQVRQKKT